MPHLQHSTPFKRQRKENISCAAITISQHVLLLAATFVLGASVYLICVGAVTADLLTPSILFLASATISIFYLAMHNAVAYLHSKATTESRSHLRMNLQWMATLLLSLAVTIWLTACGLSIVFTLSRPPYCANGPSTLTSTVAGASCIVQRSSIAASLLALFVSISLFILVQKTSKPFYCHLLGVAKEPSLLPLTVSHKTKAEKDTYSEMSFKCRSSTTTSSHTLVASQTDSLTQLLPSQPERAHGLGIYTPRQSTPSFLAPRPSLSSLRTCSTKSSLPPRPSPLPPLPAFFPDKLLRSSAMTKAIRPTRRAYHLNHTESEKTVRIVPPSPALSTAHLEAFNRSTESLSSIYSRSISGEKHSPRPGAMSEGSRSCSSSSTATVVKSPLGAMRLASSPETVVVSSAFSRISRDSSISEIDDVANLHAKVQSVKAARDSNEFGELETCSAERHLHMSYCERAKEVDEDGVLKRVNFTPLMVQKTRDVPPMFQSRHISGAD